MSLGKNAKRLEAEVQKLNSVINNLVEENYQLKTLLNQFSQPSQNTKQSK